MTWGRVRVNVGDEATTGDFVVDGDLTALGNMAITGTVDGRDVSVDGDKLDGIETSATADQTAEEIQDIVGAMLSGNTETDITVTYQDGDGTIDFTVDSHDNLTGYVADEHIDWTADQGGTDIHTGNYTNTTYTSGSFNHDDLVGFVANEHIDWTADQGGTDIHTGNYTNTTYTSGSFNHDDLVGFVANEHIDWSATNAANIHADNYTNTTYSVGDGGLTTKDFTTTLYNKLDGIEDSATADQTAAEIRSLVGSAVDSNVYTDSESTRVAVDYLPLTGGTLTGDLTISAANPTIVFDDTDNTHHWRFYQASDYTYIQYSSDSGSSYATNVQMYGTTEFWTVKHVVSGKSYPAQNNTHTSGLSYLGNYWAWSDLFTYNVTDLSDGDHKTVSGAPPGVDFINRLNPVAYTWNDGGTRTHWGLIAQEVRDALGDHGLTPGDIAVWTDASNSTSTDPADQPGENATTDENQPQFGLRYKELIAPLVKAVQELSSRVAALEA